MGTVRHCCSFVGMLPVLMHHSPGGVPPFCQLLGGAPPDIAAAATVPPKMPRSSTQGRCQILVSQDLAPERIKIETLGWHDSTVQERWHHNS